ncbi:MAG: SIS domain-containing protein [Pirellulales bacterium]|nr:SIS domain-containing protein [Pirellulales bacterium]
MQPQSYVRDYLVQTGSLVARLDVETIGTAIEWIRAAAATGKTLYACGNGGSAQIASHMTSEMVKHASVHCKIRFKMICLADNIGTMLSYANDVDFESIFVEPLKNFAGPGDLLIAISGSGNSENVLRAVEYAKQISCKTIGLTTNEGGRLKDLVDLPLAVPSTHMGHLEDCFLLMTHILCYAFIDGAV